MTSHQPAACCTVGVKHEGAAVGELGKFGDVEAYFSYPKDRSTQNAILIITDVLGHKFLNVQLIADQFAANGYFVVIPNLFGDNPVQLNPPEGFNVMEWLKDFQTHNIDPIIAASIKELRGPLGSKRIGAVGYCFGGKYLCRFLKTGQIDVGYTAHPSFVDKEELEGIQGPLSISTAETDQIFPAEKRHETEEILLKLSVPYQLNLFSDVAHGFAVRTDVSKKPGKFAKEQAFLQAVAWFNEYLKSA
ncbi:alpha/beta-hydrolase [Mytilinidion resinicola]|uniref:Alpha/beta-hydrolase n=1 Tax=Mytilinidion resinicola TaxID=574789 RepID=A0A6A6YGZ7_9PEZI|nr:alpha/beta-hydrolase [Mytilinidion resinicola]KAF2808092.1 alpha/beta-hydrolase [Mytilinidion resinicola]